MPQRLTHPEELLLATRSDIFVLQIQTGPGVDAVIYRTDESRVTDILHWLGSRGVETTKIASFADIEIFDEWPGWYHVDFKGLEDSTLIEYASIYEDVEGKPLDPDRFQIVAISYDDLVREGGPERYQEYLNSINDPDPCP
jgi:hypothetical protein